MQRSARTPKRGDASSPHLPHRWKWIVPCGAVYPVPPRNASPLFLPHESRWGDRGLSMRQISCASAQPLAGGPFCHFANPQDPWHDQFHGRIYCLSCTSIAVTPFLPFWRALRRSLFSRARTTEFGRGSGNLRQRFEPGSANGVCDPPWRTVPLSVPPFHPVKRTLQEPNRR
jgi:hypothetical protein